MIVCKVRVFVEAFSRLGLTTMSTHGARHIHKYAKGFCECLWYAVRLPDFPIRMLSW